MQQELVAGTTLNFPTAGGDFPASAGWTLKYYLVRRSGAGTITLTATTSGDDYVVQVPASTTANWVPDTYAWESRAEKGAEKYPVESGQIVILPDITQQTGTFDSRTVAERAYEDARSAYADFATANVAKKRYRIGDREMEFSSSAEIVEKLNYWASQVNRERRQAALAAGRPDPNKVYVRHVRE